MKIYKIYNSKYNQLHNIVEEMTIASGLSKIPDIYILNSEILNAYACGLSPKHSSIVVSKGLIESLSRYELEAVIGHEISHIANRDTTYLLCSGALYNTANNFTNFFKAGVKSEFYILSFLFYFFSCIGQSICFILFMFISRNREFIADACSCQYTRYPQSLADALMKIQHKNSYLIKSFPNKCDNLVKASFVFPITKKIGTILSTHPLTCDRISILLNMTSADYIEYEKEFKRKYDKKLIPESVLKNTKTLKIRQANNIVIPSVIADACALDKSLSGSDEKMILKDNKNILDENIKKHIEVENMVKDLAGYIRIECSCGTILKVPSRYKNTIVICPHCNEKHLIK